MATAQALQVVDVLIDDLRPDPANPRRISEAQLESLTRSLKEYGFVQPVLARREDKTVIGGHQRILAARRLGYKTVPVIFLPEIQVWLGQSTDEVPAGHLHGTIFGRQQGCHELVAKAGNAILHEGSNDHALG